MEAKQLSQRTWRVLVVDDKPEEAERLLLRLRRQGWEVWFAGGGEQALDVVRVDHPDAIICDLEMPGMGGYQVLEAIGNNTRTRNTPFLLANVEWTWENWSRSAGGRTADCHISKPYGEDELRGMVCLFSRMFQNIEAEGW